MTLTRFVTLILVSGLALVACSSTPKAKNMVARDRVGVEAHGATVGVNVEGGGGLDYRIANEAFEEAVRTSLSAAGLFSSIVSIERADYRLDAIRGDCRQPAAGIHMTVIMNVLWNLSEVSTERTVWQELIESEFTATVGDSFSAVNRMRRATEGAARRNIEEAIRRISDAELR